MTAPILSEVQITSVFYSLLRQSPRDVDILLLRLKVPTIKNVANYIWEFKLDKPEEPDLTRIEAEVKRLVKEIYQ